MARLCAFLHFWMCSFLACRCTVVTQFFAKLTCFPGPRILGLDCQGAHKTSVMTDFAFFGDIFHLHFAAVFHAGQAFIRAS
jgi:hypothetical protein